MEAAILTYTKKTAIDALRSELFAAPERAFHAFRHSFQACFHMFSNVFHLKALRFGSLKRLLVGHILHCFIALCLGAAGQSVAVGAPKAQPAALLFGDDLHATHGR